jgi:hypothetical protein
MKSKFILFSLLILASNLTGCIDISNSKPIIKKYTSTSDPKNSINIKAVGDLMIGSTFPNSSRLPINEGKDIFKLAQKDLSGSDILFGNLEGPLVDQGQSVKCGARSNNCFAFKSPTKYGEIYQKAGFDVFSIANNHANDFGENGINSTRKTLNKFDINYAGGLGSNAEVIKTVKDQKVGFIAFGHNPGMLNINDIETAKSKVKNLSSRVDIVVVSFHGGAEGTDRVLVPNGNENYLGESRGDLQLFAKSVIDSGADLVLGHGPHVIRGLDVYKDRMIVYSMGNFATYGWFVLANETAQTAIFDITLRSDGSFEKGKIFPYILKDKGVPVPDESKKSIQQVQKLNKLNFKNRVNVANNGVISITK